MDTLYTALKNYGRLKNNIRLANFTTFKIGGPAKYFIEVKETEKLISLLNFLSQEGISYFLLGGGSNILFKDEEYDGVVIRVKTNHLESNSTVAKADAGVLLSAIVNLASKNSFAGMEWGVGVPGTIGAAVRGNAGAMGKETSNCVSKVTVWRSGEILEIAAKDCNFSYRESIFKHNGDVVLAADYSFVPGDKAKIMEAMQGYIKQRAGRYPAEPSAGSFFKNIDIKNWPGDIAKLPELFKERGKVPVGWCVEQVQMKGFAVGGAKVSDEHGNFIVNFNNASQKDVLAVVEAVQGKVYNKFGVQLEPEVEII